jgi:hypothetical protein
MNIFTANQVNQVYVLKSDSTVVANLDASHQITKSNNLGSVGLGVTPDGKSIYFKHYGAGGVTRSDLIDIANIIDVKATPASKMARNLSSALVTLNSEALDNSKPVAGQDFVLRLQFQNPVGMSPDNQYWKFGVVHSTASMTASNFYLKLASSIAKNMSREAVQLVKVYVTYSTASKTEITANSDVSNTTTFNQTYTGVLIEEVEQDWILGVKQQKPTIFTVNPTWVNAGTASAPNEVVWGDVIYNNGQKVVGGADPYNTVDTSNAPASAGEIVNSKLIADYEYFYMGERGDQYRMVGFPNYIPTTYLVDPTAKYGYDTIAIHFAYVGANHSVQKSEKDITILVPRVKTDDYDSAAATSVNPTKKAAIGAKTKSLVDAIEAVYPVSYTKAESDAKYAAKSNG